MSTVYVVGLGPGAEEQMTVRAQKVLEHCPVLIGYNVYIDLVKEQFPDKIFLSTPMRKEPERCRMAFEEAEKGQDVAMICSGARRSLWNGRIDLRDRKRIPFHPD